MSPKQLIENDGDSRQLTAVFNALADPTRREILRRLTTGDASVAELAAPFAVTQPAISKHLKVLEQAGLISRTRRATSRMSHLEAEPLREATEWLAQYREHWEESYERLDERLASLQHGSAAEERPPAASASRESETGSEDSVDAPARVTATRAEEGTGNHVDHSDHC